MPGIKVGWNAAACRYCINKRRSDIGRACLFFRPEAGKIAPGSSKIPIRFIRSPESILL